MTIRIEMTIAIVGWLMKNFEIIRFHHGDLISPLQFGNTSLRNKNGRAVDGGRRMNSPELSRAKNIAWIREGGHDPNRARLCVDLPVRENNFALVRVLRSVGEFQLQFERFSAGLCAIA